MCKRNVIKDMVNILFGNDVFVSEFSEFCSFVYREKGEILFLEGEEGHYIYFLVSGKIKLFRTNEDGKESVIHFVSKGEIFAEILIKEDFYPVSAMTIKPSDIVRIDKVKFLSFISRNPSFTIEIIAMLINRIKYLADVLQNISVLNAKTKFMNYLENLKRKQNSNKVVLDIPKNEIASFLGITKETFSRIKRKLQDDGIISVDANTIEILENQ